MNRSIQAEDTFGVLKWDRLYKSLFHRGKQNVILEFTLISCGFNLYKYHNKKHQKIKPSNARTDICRNWRYLIRDLFYSPFYDLLTTEVKVFADCAK